MPDLPIIPGICMTPSVADAFMPQRNVATDRTTAYLRVCWCAPMARARRSISRQPRVTSSAVVLKPGDSDTTTRTEETHRG